MIKLTGRQKWNGYFEPYWKDKENEYPIKEIITNLFCTSQKGLTACKFCGSEFPSIQMNQMEAAMSCEHGRGCVWAESLRLFGHPVNQR